MGMSKELYQNAKKPQGSGGKFVINRMNERHRHLAGKCDGAAVER